LCVVLQKSKSGITTLFGGSLSARYTGTQARNVAMDRRRTYAVVLEPEAEGGFTVRVPAFPEIITYGSDEREALAMAEDAIRLVIEDCAARGEPVSAGEPPRIREVTVTLAA
jgi:predicted RNase H-like HicB family nuclease